MIIKEGYAALSSRVATTLDIRLNTEVKMIRLDDAQSNVEVVINSEGKTTSLRAGYVVVTLPLGVLKSRVVSDKATHMPFEFTPCFLTGFFSKAHPALYFVLVYLWGSIMPKT